VLLVESGDADTGRAQRAAQADEPLRILIFTRTPMGQDA
jgi:hypothetical protein